VLPVRPPRDEDAALPGFGPPEESPPMPTELLRSGPAGRSLTHDLATGRVELTYDWDVGGLVRLPNGLEVEDVNRTMFAITEGDPLSAAVRCSMGGTFGRGAWRTRCATESVMTSDAEAFQVESTLRAWEGDALAFERTWRSDIPRDLV
jgi:hypothetical protein